MNRAAERPHRGLWRTEVVRAMLSGHSILGIAFAAIIYLVCLTGTICVFMHDFQRWEQPGGPIVRQASDAAVARALTAFAPSAGANPIYVTLPSTDLPRLVVSSEDTVRLADATGALVAEQHDPWIDFVGDLHTRLDLPVTWGRFVVGLAGVALLSSLISGVLSHPRVFRDAFHLRLGGSWRLEQADLHNRLGVWPLPFHVLVSLTGALLGLSTIIVGILALLLFHGDTKKVYALLAAPPPAPDARPAPTPDIAAMLAAARRRTPDAEPRLMTVTNWGRRDLRVSLTAARPRLIAQQDSFAFDAGGRLVGERHPGGLTLGEEILGTLGPLHYGWFGGAAVRLIYGLLGLALCVVTSSGINVWLARRRDKGRAAPLWERVWAVIAWGQPIILAALALIALLLPSAASGGTALTMAWTGLTALSIAAAVIVSVDGAVLSWVARRVLAGGLIVIACLHGGPMISSSAIDGAAIAIDLTLLASGAALFVASLRVRAMANGQPRALGRL